MPDVAASLNNLADAYLLDNKPRDALPLLERALVIVDTYEGVQAAEFYAHYNLARALIATGGDRARALALARRARDGLREAGEARPLAEIEQFLADRR
jgi:hypothetical protein